MKVFVYFNLHKKVFSIKALEGAKKGLVIGHSDKVLLNDVTFKVSQAGRNRVLATKRKNVHAGVVGTLLDIDTNLLLDGVSVTYNPYKYDSFVTKDNEKPIHNATSALLINKKIWI